MKVDSKLISEISSIMKLEFSEEELQTLVQEINGILTMLDSLKEVDTEGIEGTFYGIVNHETELRADEPVQDQEQVQAILEKANANQNNLIKVPAMLDDGEGGA